MRRREKRSANQDDLPWPWPWVTEREAVWLRGPVPSKYWNSARNRERYLYWLGGRLGYRTMEDWYRLTTDDFKHHGGAGVLCLHWKWSAVWAVKTCFPRYDWKEWRFAMCSRSAPDRRPFEDYFAGSAFTNFQAR